HRGARPGDQRHGVEMPELEMAAPRNVGCCEDEEPAYEVEQDPEVAAVKAIDQHAAEERHKKSWQRHDDDLPANLYGRVRCGHDVPAHAGEVHPAAEERHEHGEKEIAEAALRPDQLPIHAVCH